MEIEKLEKELHNFEFEVRAENNATFGDHLEGTPIVFNKKTDLGEFDEIIDSGALDNTDLRDVRFLVNHNVEMIPLARSRRNNKNSTMQMVVNESGMDIRVNLDTENNTEAKNLYSAVERGDVSGMSFMFTVRGDTWEGLDTARPVRHITDIGKVFEVSAVTFPAYEQTSINARSASETLEKARETLENAKRAQEEKELEERNARLLAEMEERKRHLTLLEFENL